MHCTSLLSNLYVTAIRNFQTSVNVGTDDFDKAFIMEPWALSELGPMMLGRYVSPLILLGVFALSPPPNIRCFRRYNDIKYVQRLNLHFLTAAKRLDRIPDLKLGLPGRWAGLTLRGLIKRFCALTNEGELRQGWIGGKTTPSGTTVSLPIWRPSPSHVEPTPKVLTKGYTMTCVQALNHNSIAMIEALEPVLRSAAAAQGDGSEEACWAARSEQLYPGGVAAFQRVPFSVIGPRNKLGRTASPKGIHRDEAMINCMTGRPAGTIDMTREVRLGDGETVDSIPLAWVGERCLDAAKTFNNKHTDITKRAYIHELLEVVVQQLGGHEVGAGLESCMHAPFAGTEEAAEMQRVLKLIADGSLPGIECKAPSRPQSLADMYKAERTDLLCAREPKKARAEHRRAATETWNSTYKENVPNQIRDLSELRARHKGLHQQYDEEFAAWMEGMEDRPVASTSGNASATSSAAVAASAASVQALRQATGEINS